MPDILRRDEVLMPLSFNFVRLINFPEDPSFRTVENISLLSDMDQNQEEATTQVSLKEKAFVEGVDRYIVKHDYLVKLVHPGRARGKTFKEYITQYEFPTYLVHAKGKSFATLVVRTKSKVAHDCVRRLNDKVGSFATEPVEVDFDKVRPQIQHIKGAWFGEMKAANINSTGLFGPHVDLSKEFKHAEGIGKLNAVVVLYPFQDSVRTVMITRNGGVLLYDTFETEEAAFELVQDIRAKLLDHAWVGPKKRGKKA
ncbi:MAG: hypothetical protein L0Z51_07860 [Candidatus Latescibacteria bacterium]|nr:hypothetical protein [Candidatus Latescibacterota bacterium]